MSVVSNKSMDYNTIQKNVAVTKAGILTSGSLLTLFYTCDNGGFLSEF
jgi:hypothetical protein